MRKYVLSVLALFVAVGFTIAGEVVFMSYDKEKKELKVKEDDKEKTYKVTDKTKFMRNDKDVPNDKGMEALDKMNSNEKVKGKGKLEITTEKDTVTEIKMKGGKKN